MSESYLPPNIRNLNHRLLARNWHYLSSMATSSSSAHRLDVARVRKSDEPDPLLPSSAEEDGRPGCQYFGDDAPTVRLLVPTAASPTPSKETDSIPTTPMARLRLRRVVKRVDSED